MSDAPIARWLRETRERQIRDDGLSWSQDDLLAAMRSAIDWAPHRPNYSRYETGKATPQPETLAKFVAFWKTRGQPGPDLAPPRPEPTLDPYVVIDRLSAALESLSEELRGAREERAGLRDQVETLQHVVNGLVSQAIAAGSAPRAPRESTGSGR